MCSVHGDAATWLACWLTARTRTHTHTCIDEEEEKEEKQTKRAWVSQKSVLRRDETSRPAAAPPLPTAGSKYTQLSQLSVSMSAMALHTYVRTVRCARYKLQTGCTL